MALKNITDRKGEKEDGQGTGPGEGRDHKNVVDSRTGERRSETSQAEGAESGAGEAKNQGGDREGFRAETNRDGPDQGGRVKAGNPVVLEEEPG